MPKLNLQEYERAADGSSVVFRDLTDHTQAGYLARNTVALVAFVRKLRFQCDNEAGTADYLLRVPHASFPDQYTLTASDAAAADAFRVNLPSGGVFALYVFAVPKKGDLIETSGSDFTGNLYWNAATNKLEKLIGSHPVTITDAYAQAYGYADAAALFADETAAGGFLVPHFSYDYELVSDEEELFNTTFNSGEAQVMNQVPYRKAASAWWMHLHRQRHCLGEQEKKEYDFFMFDLEGACARFEGEYYEDAAEIMESLDKRVPATLNHH